MAKALGHAPGQQDAWSKRVDGWGTVTSTAKTPEHGIPQPVIDLALQVEDAPRHLGIHSGGMVICDRPVIEVCPVEWGRMEDRSVLQWDKDDCAAAGLVKFDLLGLGMLSALHYAVDLIREHRGYEVDIATIPQEDEVYAMLCRADTVGVFQIESRAQMATLPRLRPRTFYDLVVEVALIRPGPIQGGSVHPYIRRRNGQEPVTYLHPLLEKSLAKTLGVPLFQEQLMQMAIDVAGFTPAESDELRQAMGSKRSAARMERLRERLYEGMAANGITGDIADELFVKMKAFANYGFPESHSVSFAYLVYASSWIKHHEPAAFCAALLNAQPMGFWSPHTLVRDARRHGVVVRTPDLNASLADRHARTIRVLEVIGVWGVGKPALRHSDDRQHSDGGAAATGGAVGDRVGARDRRRAGHGDRGRAGRARAVPRHRGPRAAGAGGRPRAAGGDGHRRAVRGVLRLGAAGGAVGGRRRRPVPARPPGRHRHRRHRPAPARDVTGRGGGRRPVGHRRLARRPPDQLPASASLPPRASSRRRACGTSRPGRGSPSPASSPTASAR